MQSEVIEEIAKHLGVTPQDIDPLASLTDDLGLGPVEIADLLSALSKRFSVTFDPAEVENLRTVNDMVVTIEDLSLE
ncbi:acyl carrier protein [Candidatus Daviesbacteria bacterium]|nr:acyl carrier protein [Candidatus Daviesbacteria bacterium]